MNEVERPKDDKLTLTNAECAGVMGISESRFYELKAAKLIPQELLSPIPGRWSREKVVRWLAGGPPVIRAKRSRGRAA